MDDSRRSSSTPDIRRAREELLALPLPLDRADYPPPYFVSFSARPQVLGKRFVDFVLEHFAGKPYLWISYLFQEPFEYALCQMVDAPLLDFGAHRFIPLKNSRATTPIISRVVVEKPDTGATASVFIGIPVVSS
jgi:hypothetical protein